MKKISVVYQGWGQRYPLGLLADNGSELLFEYTAEAIAHKTELSPLKLALRTAAYGGFPRHQQRLPGLIADALPDGWGMLLMDRWFRRKGWDPARVSPLDRLAFIGSRAMGALSFEPAEGIALSSADVDLLHIAQEVQQTITASSQALLLELALMGGSPHGARPKVLVNYDPVTGSMSNTEQGAGTPWMVKFQAQNEHKEVCAIEQLYADLAHACHIDMPATRHFELNDTLAAFAAQRFDRDDGMRVPMLTMAGALDADFRLPAMGYTDALRLTRFITGDVREVVKAFERCAFNVLFNNRDDHTKNFSFRLGQDLRWRLSPAYDLTFNEGPGGEHQMDICGEGRHPTRGDMLKLAKDADIPVATAGQCLERFAEVATHFKAMAKAYPIRLSTIQHMASKIAVNRALLINNKP